MADTEVDSPWKARSTRRCGCGAASPLGCRLSAPPFPPVSPEQAAAFGDLEKLELYLKGDPGCSNKPDEGVRNVAFQFVHSGEHSCLPGQPGADRIGSRTPAYHDVVPYPGRPRCRRDTTRCSGQR